MNTASLVSTSELNHTSVHTTKGILEYMHANLWGPSHKKSLGGASYMLNIIDDYSREGWPYFLKH
jgi:hypothetical protein